MTHVLAIKGMNDVLPAAAEPFLNSPVWRRIFDTAAEVLGSYGYAPVWLPIVEDTALFSRGIGEDTDIVAKEMYSFTDRGERQLTLRPEGTAGAVRSYIENNLGRTSPMQRWWYAGPMFRAERPQKGRYRQFYQIGAEFFGVGTPASDAELILMVHAFCTRLGLRDIGVKINTLGDDDSRAKYRETLQKFLRSKQADLCESCQKRLETNPLRVLDCKRSTCRAVVELAPDMLDSLTANAAAHFTRVQEILSAGNLSYVRDPRLVRGLDYYTGTIFEFTTTALGAQDAILGGGRYDNLVQELGGPATQAIGFAAGVERLALLLTQEPTPARQGPDIYLVPMDDAALTPSFALAASLREHRVQVDVDVSGARLKQQMRQADRVGAQHVLVLGADELQSQRGKLKNLTTGESHDIILSAAAITQHLRTRTEIAK